MVFAGECVALVLRLGQKHGKRHSVCLSTNSGANVLRTTSEGLPRETWPWSGWHGLGEASTNYGGGTAGIVKQMDTLPLGVWPSRLHWRGGGREYRDDPAWPPGRDDWLHGGVVQRDVSHHDPVPLEVPPVHGAEGRWQPGQEIKAEALTVV